MNQKLILIVEDDNDIRDLIGYILSKDIYRLKLCATIHKAKKEIREETPDLIILDIMLPDGSGIDLCRQIKNHPETSQVPIILMSALAEPENTADCFISKPFNIALLRERAEQYI